MPGVGWGFRDAIRDFALILSDVDPPTHFKLGKSV